MNLDEVQSCPVGTEFYIRVRSIAPVDREGFIKCALAESIGLLPRTYSFTALECIAPPPAKPRPLQRGDAIVNLTPESTGQIGQLIEIYGANAVVKFDGNYGFAPVSEYRRARISDILSDILSDSRKETVH